MAKPRFEESQLFSQVWLWLVIGLSMVIGWWALLSTVVKLLPVPHGFGINWPETALGGVLAWLLTGVLVPLLMVLMKLVVRVRRDEIEIRFLPFTRRRIPMRDIVSAVARTYEPI